MSAFMKILLAISDRLRRISDKVPSLTYLVDSVYVAARKDVSNQRGFGR